MLLALYAIILLLGFYFLLFGANKFIDGCCNLATMFGLPSLIIGVFIVGFGTSAPEILVSLLASLQKSDVALGNAIGSNITNIGLVIGVTAIISPILCKRKILTKELILLLILSIFATCLILDGQLVRWNGIVLIALFGAFAAYSYIKAKNDTEEQKHLQEEIEEKENEIGHTTSKLKTILWVVGGLIIMLISSQAVIHSCSSIAKMFGVNDMIIGLTIVALGTSLPELASSITAIKRQEHDIVLGNIIGSNIFNLLLVIGTSAVVYPFKVDAITIYRDCSVMIGLIVLLFIFGFRFKKNIGTIGRFAGIIFLIIYLSYTTYLGYTVYTSSNKKTELNKTESINNKIAE